jgi:hypothetical protein
MEGKIGIAFVTALCGAEAAAKFAAEGVEESTSLGEIKEIVEYKGKLWLDGIIPALKAIKFCKELGITWGSKENDKSEPKDPAPPSDGLQIATVIAGALGKITPQKTPNQMTNLELIQNTMSGEDDGPFAEEIDRREIEKGPMFVANSGKILFEETSKYLVQRNKGASLKSGRRFGGGFVRYRTEINSLEIQLSPWDLENLSMGEDQDGVKWGEIPTETKVAVLWMRRYKPNRGVLTTKDNTVEAIQKNSEIWNNMTSEFKEACHIDKNLKPSLEAELTKNLGSANRPFNLGR